VIVEGESRLINSANAAGRPLLRAKKSTAVGKVDPLIHLPARDGSPTRALAYYSMLSQLT
jgi:hypothetical protein